MTTNRWMAVVLMFIVLGAACAGPEPVSKTAERAGKNAFYYEKAQSLFIKGCYAKALAYLNEAHKRYTAADDAGGAAHSLLGMANVYFRLGDYTSAILLYDEAILTYDRADDLHGRVRAFCGKAAALMDIDRLPEAVEALNRADDAGGDQQILTGLRVKQRALLLIRQGNVAQARDMLAKALKHADQNDPGTTADIYYSLGHLIMAENPDQACTYFDQALVLDRASGAFAHTAKDLQALGKCSVAKGQQAQALDFLKRSIQIYALIGDERQVAEILPAMKAYADETGANIQAVLHFVEQWRNGKTESNICE